MSKLPPPGTTERVRRGLLEEPRILSLEAPTGK